MRGSRHTLVMLVMGAAAWTQLSLLPALARPSPSALASTLPALAALGLTALWAQRGDDPAHLPRRRWALMAGAAGFPLAMGLSALWVGQLGLTRFDLGAQLLGTLTALGFAASVAAWWSGSAPRHATLLTAARVDPPAAPPRLAAAAPPLADAARALVALTAFGLAVVAPGWILAGARTLPSPSGEYLLRGRQALVTAGGLGLAVAFTLSVGAGLLRRGPPRAYNPRRALWLLAGGFAAVSMRLWLDRAR